VLEAHLSSGPTSTAGVKGGPVYRSDQDFLLPTKLAPQYPRPIPTAKRRSRGKVARCFRAEPKRAGISSPLRPSSQPRSRATSRSCALLRGRRESVGVGAPGKRGESPKAAPPHTSSSSLAPLPLAAMHALPHGSATRRPHAATAAVRGTAPGRGRKPDTGARSAPFAPPCAARPSDGAHYLHLGTKAKQTETGKLTAESASLHPSLESLCRLTCLPGGA